MTFKNFACKNYFNKMLTFLIKKEFLSVQKIRKNKIIFFSLWYRSVCRTIIYTETVCTWFWHWQFSIQHLHSTDYSANFRLCLTFQWVFNKWHYRTRAFFLHTKQKNVLLSTHRHIVSIFYWILFFKKIKCELFWNKSFFNKLVWFK